jgi:hypothetical protein
MRTFRIALAVRNGTLQAEGYATVKVAIRHKRRLPTGLPPFILPRLRDSLDLRSIFCAEDRITFLSKKWFFFWQLTRSAMFYFGRLSNPPEQVREPPEHAGGRRPTPRFRAIAYREMSDER